MRRIVTIAAVTLASLSGAGSVGVAHAAPAAGPIAGLCFFTGETVSDFNSTQPHTGPLSATGVFIARECVQPVTGP